MVLEGVEWDQLSASNQCKPSFDLRPALMNKNLSLVVISYLSRWEQNFDVLV